VVHSVGRGGRGRLRKVELVTPTLCAGAVWNILTEYCSQILYLGGVFVWNAYREGLRMQIIGGTSSMLEIVKEPICKSAERLTSRR
jgi:hypothetical protein